MIQAGPLGVAQVQAAPAQVVRRNNVDIASRLLPIWFSEVDRLVTDEAIKDSSRQALEDLKKKSEEARQALEKLERRLQEAIEQKSKEEKAKQEEKPQAEKPQQKPSASEKQS
jgi:ribosome recycling factor